VRTFTVLPTYFFIPGTVLFITVLVFNLFGDAVRDALDPRAGRG
jgi:peptide/nickel transport system permease protein